MEHQFEKEEGGSSKVQAKGDDYNSDGDDDDAIEFMKEEMGMMKESFEKKIQDLKETEQRLFFLLLLLLALRDQSSSTKRITNCVHSLWKQLPRIAKYCTSMLEHPRSDVQILAATFQHRMVHLPSTTGAKTRDAHKTKKAYCPGSNRPISAVWVMLQ